MTLRLFRDNFVLWRYSLGNYHANGDFPIMVRRSRNGDLSWMQAGVLVTITKEDTIRYTPSLQTEEAQGNAEKTNRHNLDKYMNELATAQKNVDASKPIPGIPVKPLHISVADPYNNGDTVTPGVTSTGPWPDPPGLPDLKPKMIYPSGGGQPIEEPIIFAGSSSETYAADAPPPPHKK